MLRHRTKTHDQAVIQAQQPQMDFKSTVLRCNPEGERHSLYAVRSSRVPVATADGLAAAAPLLLRERTVKREMYRRRGDFMAEEEHQKVDGETGHWAVADFTGNFHRHLIQQEPTTAVPGHQLVREDRRPNAQSREADLAARSAAIQKVHLDNAAAIIRREATRARVANAVGPADMTLRAVHGTIEKQIMLAEAEVVRERELEKLAMDATLNRSHVARVADSPAEKKLLRMIASGNEIGARFLVRGGAEAVTDVMVCSPEDGRTTLHVCWDFWESQYGLTGSVQAVMKEDSRYGRAYKKVADARRGGGMPRAEGSLVREPMEPEVVEIMRQPDSAPRPKAGPRAERVMKCFDACCCTEYMVALVLISARKRCRGAPWDVRHFVNSVDRTGASALHVAASRGHVAVMHELLVLGGDLTVQNDKGET